VAPDCRVVYVDNDPIVLVHARALLQPHRWRPGPGDLSPDQEITAWCGVARKS
jgi:hypothetical protein